MNHEVIAACARLCEEAMHAERAALSFDDHAAAGEFAREAQAYSRIAFDEAQA